MVEICEEGEGEEDYGEDAEGEVWYVAIDDDSRVIWSLWSGKVGIDEPASFWLLIAGCQLEAAHRRCSRLSEILGS